jgi:hypothetical protein
LQTIRFIEGVSPDGGFNDFGTNYCWGLTEHSVRALDLASGHIETITWLRDDNWLIVTDDGHFSCSPGIARKLIYVVETDEGEQLVLSPAEFGDEFGWKNDPSKVRLPNP